VVGERPDLVDRVERAELGRLGDADRQWLRAVLVAPAPGLSVDEVGRELAVGRVDGQQLEPADALGCTALVGVDVRRRRIDDCTPSRHDAGQSHDVGARAVEDGVDLDLGPQEVAHGLDQPGGPVVLAVGRLVTDVGLRDRRQHLRMGPCVVVAGEAADLFEMDHDTSLPAAVRQARSA
jgi:hypothetical protein